MGPANHQDTRMLYFQERQELNKQLKEAQEYKDKYLKREADVDEVQDLATQELAKVKHMVCCHIFLPFSLSAFLITSFHLPFSSVIHSPCFHSVIHSTVFLLLFAHLFLPSFPSSFCFIFSSCVRHIGGFQASLLSQILILLAFFLLAD